MIEQLKDLSARLVVELSRGLVREEQRRLIGKRNSNGNALLLAAREMLGLVVHTAAQPDERQEIGCPFPAVRAATPGKHHRQLDVLDRRQVREQIASGLLPDKANLVAAVFDDLCRGHVQHVIVANVYSPGRWGVVAGQDVQKR